MIYNIPSNSPVAGNPCRVIRKITKKTAREYEKIISADQCNILNIGNIQRNTGFGEMFVIIKSATSKKILIEFYCI